MEAVAPRERRLNRAGQGTKDSGWAQPRQMRCTPCTSIWIVSLGRMCCGWFSHAALVPVAAARTTELDARNGATATATAEIIGDPCALQHKKEGKKVVVVPPRRNASGCSAVKEARDVRFRFHLHHHAQGGIRPSKREGRRLLPVLLCCC